MHHQILRILLDARPDLPEISEESPLYLSDLSHNRFHTVKLLNLLLVVFYYSNKQANSQRNTKS